MEEGGQIPALEDQLHRTVSDKVGQQRRLIILHRQIDSKLTELKSTIDANDTRGFAAKAIVTTDVGLQAMHAGLIDAIVSAEDALLAQRMDRAAQGEQETARASFVGGVLAFLLMASGALLGVSAFREWSGRVRLGADLKAPTNRVAGWIALGYSSCNLTGEVHDCYRNGHCRKACRR